MEYKRGSVFYYNGCKVKVVKAPMAKDNGLVEVRFQEDMWNDTGTIVRAKGEKTRVMSTQLRLNPIG